MAKPAVLISLYVAIFCVVTVIGFMAHYALINARVRRESRCLRDKLESAKGGVYDVTAVSDQDTSLYTLSYNKKTKSVEHKCACPPGDTINHFRNIKYYDQKVKKEGEIKDLMCSCDGSYDGVGDDIFYKGYPGLVRYMQGTDRSFFDTDFTYLAYKTPDKTTTATVTARNSSSNALYDVSYNVDLLMSTKDNDLPTNPYTITCACPRSSGSLSNYQFDVRVYNKNRSVETVPKTCECDKDITGGSTASSDHYVGPSGLVNFMKDNSLDFFNDIMPSS